MNRVRNRRIGLSRNFDIEWMFQSTSLAFSYARSNAVQLPHIVHDHLEGAIRTKEEECRLHKYTGTYNHQLQPYDVQNYPASSMNLALNVFSKNHHNVFSTLLEQGIRC